MLRKWLFLAALAGRIASGQALTYSSDSIVNGANYAPGPFAPNSIISIFGENLAWGTVSMPPNSGSLPLQLGGVEVDINGSGNSAPLIFVSPTQINLLIPGYLLPGVATLVVHRQGTFGPSANINLIAVAPQLFVTSDGFVIAQHADYSQITSDAPAQPGEIIIVYATGLGLVPSLVGFEANAIPQLAFPTDTDLEVLLNGNVVATWANGGNQGTNQIQYAGVTPGSAGIYQINLVLPTDLPANPEIRVSAGGQMSTAGVVLPTQPTCD